MTLAYGRDHDDPFCDVCQMLRDDECECGDDGSVGAATSVEHRSSSDSGIRKVRFRSAADIPIRVVRWLWTGRLPAGELTLLAGREGIGKSTAAYAIAADVTRGRLEGDQKGTPRNVAIAATEDSWSHTIVPRLIAAGADLHRVFHVDAVDSVGMETDLILPRDLDATEQEMRDRGIALLLLDPLLSRVDARLDTHKDAEVRRALEPMVNIAHRTEASVIGIIHVNKGAATDPVNTVMGSRAFTAVARSVLFVMPDLDDESSRILGLAKSNLGRTDLPTLTFRIESRHVADTEDGPVHSGAVRWTGERSESIRDMFAIANEPAETRTAVADAVEWLRDWLAHQGGSAPHADVMAAGAREGHGRDALKRARKRAGVESQSTHTVPRTTWWTLPEAA